MTLKQLLEEQENKFEEGDNLISVKEAKILNRHCLIELLNGIMEMIKEMKQECFMCSNFPKSYFGHDLEKHSINKVLSEIIIMIEELKV